MRGSLELKSATVAEYSLPSETQTNKKRAETSCKWNVHKRHNPIPVSEPYTVLYVKTEAVDCKGVFSSVTVSFKSRK